MPCRLSLDVHTHARCPCVNMTSRYALLDPILWCLQAEPKVEPKQEPDGGAAAPPAKKSKYFDDGSTKAEPADVKVEVPSGKSVAGKAATPPSASKRAKKDEKKEAGKATPGTVLRAAQLQRASLHSRPPHKHDTAYGSETRASLVFDWAQFHVGFLTSLIMLHCLILCTPLHQLRALICLPAATPFAAGKKGKGVSEKADKPASGSARKKAKAVKEEVIMVEDSDEVSV